MNSGPPGNPATRSEKPAFRNVLRAAQTGRFRLLCPLGDKPLSLSDTAPLKTPGTEDPVPDTSVGLRPGRRKGLGGEGCLTSSKNLAPGGVSHPSCRELIFPSDRVELL